MPTWAKVLIALVVLGLVGVIALVFVAGSLVANVGKQAVDPANAAKAAHEIVQIQEPLPSGWQWKMGMNMGFMKMAALMNDSSHVMINFMEIPNPKNQTPQQIMENPNTSSQTRNFVETSHGHDMVAGKDMYWKRGRAETNKGNAVMQMGIVSGANGKSIMIQVIEPEAHGDYDPSQAEPIMKRITGFVS
jgi:hypothetical protein